MTTRLQRPQRMMTARFLQPATPITRIVRLADLPPLRADPTIPPAPRTIQQIAEPSQIRSQSIHNLRPDTPGRPVCFPGNRAPGEAMACKLVERIPL